MFGWMRQRDHDAALAALRDTHTETVRLLEADAEGWRFLAMKLSADLIELQKRMVPVLIEADPGEASVDEFDADHAPSGRERRKRKDEELIS